MRLYVKFNFYSEGKNPLEVINSMREMGFTPEVGEHDFSIPFRTPEQYAEIVKEFKDAMKGTGVLFLLTTKDR